MSIPEITDADPQGREATEDAGAVASAGRCPVDHAAMRPELAASASPAVIPAASLPGPRMPVLFQLLSYWKRPAGFIEQCRERYGSRFVLRVSIPTRPLHVISDPEDVKQMFLAPDDVLHTGNGSARLENFIGHSGLAWLDEDKHKIRRRHTMQSVHGTALQRINASITDMTKREVASWPQGKAVSLYPLIHHLAINIIREVVFGAEPPECTEELIDVLEQMTEFNYKIASTLMIFRMSPAQVRLLRAMRPLGLDHFLKLREQANALIAQAVQERRTSGESGDDLLSGLLGVTGDDGSPLPAQELRDEIMTMFLAGTETTAAALTWAFEYLSREHAARGRLLTEIADGGDTYLMATIQELLRLRPSVPQIILRQVMKPVEIGGVRYEPGMLLWASAYLLHRNPDLYPDPYAFRPERFLGAKPGIYTWIPYGGGRIRCLGPSVAELEMKAVLREVLSRYELDRVDPRPEKVRTHLITPLPANGTRVVLRPRVPQASMAGS
jgi:cytochrome P450 family 135